MNATRTVSIWLRCLAVATLLAAGCATTHPKQAAIPKPSHAAAAANDFPTAIQAGIPTSTIQK
jgi:hypothetical protein